MSFRNKEKSQQRPTQHHRCPPVGTTPDVQSTTKKISPTITIPTQTAWGDEATYSHSCTDNDRAGERAIAGLGMQNPRECLKKFIFQKSNRSRAYCWCND